MHTKQKCFGEVCLMGGCLKVRKVALVNLSFFCGYQQKQDHPIILEIVFQEDRDPDGTSMR